MSVQITTDTFIIGLTALFIGFQLVVLRKDLRAKRISEVREQWIQMGMLELRTPDFHKMLIGSNSEYILENIDENGLKERAFAQLVFDMLATIYHLERGGFLKTSSIEFQGFDEYVETVMSNDKMHKCWRTGNGYNLRQNHEGEFFQQYLDGKIEMINMRSKFQSVLEQNPHDKRVKRLRKKMFRLNKLLTRHSFNFLTSYRFSRFEKRAPAIVEQINDLLEASSNDEDQES